MFPDSDNAKGYKQSETKIKYFIQFGLAHILCNPSKMIILVEHFHLSLMRQRLLEVEKQYDGFLQYWSNSMKRIVLSYCGLLFVNYYSSKNF